MRVCSACRAEHPDEANVCPSDGAALVPDDRVGSLLAPGTLVGEHRIVRLLGSGTFSDVYEAEPRAGGGRVALKLLLPSMSSDAEVVARFQAEARALGKLAHPNIVEVSSSGTYEGKRPYYAMSLLEGLTLKMLLDRDKRLSPERALPILEGIAAALDAAHAMGVVHRDVKPQNVLLLPDEAGGFTPKLVDFGVAKLLTEDMGVKTATGVAMGTPRYMSPEQCRGRAVDHRSDIYALGVMTHELLTGAPPFRSDTLADLLVAHAVDPPPPMSTVCRAVPGELDAPVLAMMAKRAKDRPASAGEAIAALAARIASVTGAQARARETMPLGTVVMEGASPAAPRAAHDAAESEAPTVALEPKRAVEALPATVLLEAPAGPPGAPARAGLTAVAPPAPRAALSPTLPGAPAHRPGPPARRPERPGPPWGLIAVAVALVAGAVVAAVALRGEPPEGASPFASATAPAATGGAATGPRVEPGPAAVPREPAAPSAPEAASAAPSAPAKPSAAPSRAPAGKPRDIGF